MKFSDYKYERPDMEKFKHAFFSILKEFEQADSFAEQNQQLGNIVELRNEFESMMNICHIRHTIDTNDAYYKEEHDFFDENSPIYEGYISKFYKKLVDSKFRSELEREWGPQLFKIAELSLKTFSDEIVGDLKKENKLASEYSKLIASAKIEFEGEERTLAQMSPFIQSKDRNMRKRASEARYGFFVKNEAMLDDIYDQLVKVRTEIARKLGYDNFVQLGYDRLTRTDYTANEVSVFRDQVKDYIIPITQKLYERQKKRIGLDRLAYYDLPFSFKTGNPTPKGNPEWIIENGKKMYAELSTKTDEFFQFMNENELMDLVSKRGKRSGGYCTYISKYKAPFIFSNFVGTSHDIDVLTHEAGHAFQVYSSRHLSVPEYSFPTYEAAEIHSMCMEFFTWPWMELFFEEDTGKYKFSHLSGALMFIPYGVAVDEFQHYVYENPDASPAERKSAWRKIERNYLPHRDFTENDYLERGGFWHQQGHIFRTPFYYIDYTLAQICALQFWRKANENKDLAWEEYLHLCKQGGSKSFTELVNVANLQSPFEKTCVQSVVSEIEKWLDSIDDQAL
ncbi:M3 family oligoendopeptidase [Pseudalkalibacillus salsuginis]|uniref:M3 family oligoendopeptidase n=1 Tax=Pseudalkalibacillus salsuginis TaxID=2910972 RepID=UPI001F4622A2|nr:M3 family oligoendopeptidase [Pseudalkalibacillus salsuginis]MCF6409323.1 M3 family oligoendopeptidase [Pseudalkalibacillus salsuginis]